MTDKELYQANVEAQLGDWRAGIGKLKDEIGQAGPKGPENDNDIRLHTLTRGLEEIERKLEQVVQADAGEWEARRTELDEALVSWRYNYEHTQVELLKTDESGA